MAGKTYIREVVTPPYGSIGAVDSPKSSQISRITSLASRVATYSPVDFR